MTVSPDDTLRMSRAELDAVLEAAFDIEALLEDDNEQPGDEQ